MIIPKANLRLKLLAKFTLVICSAMIVAMVLFAIINIKLLKNLCLQEAVKDIDNLSETVIRTTHYQMLENDRQRVYRMIQEVGTQKGIQHIRLINKDGVIICSTNDGELGTLLDKDADACNMCHFAGATLSHASPMNRSRIFRDADGKEVLGIAKGIYNQASCAEASCHFHPADAELLGVLDVTVTLDEMQSQLSLYRHSTILFTLMLLLLLALSLTLLTRRLIHQPVNLLLEHTRKLARGELNVRIEKVSRDELGELEEAFNDMTRALQRARDDLQQTRDDLQDLANSLETKVEERTREVKEIQARLMHSEKLASLGELVAGIAHEINNPLTGIMVFASMVLNHPWLDASLKTDLQTILGETRRCADIVKRLLEFSREAPPRKKPDSINGIMDMTLALVEHQASFHNILICRDYGQDLPEIMVDPNQLKQVFMNMILNAGQAMPQGGTLAITTGCCDAGGWLFIRLCDSGCGIPEENLKKIFDPFFTTKEHLGTGLGLSVSYGIIKNHGGQIEVQSEVGAGTSFIIRLPLQPPEAEPAETEGQY